MARLVFLFLPRHQFVALIWASANLALTRAAIDARPFPWLAMIGFVVGPLLFIFFAERIAAKLHRGWMERWATDWRKPQSPIPVMLVGWLGLAAQTVFLLLQQR